MNRRHLLYILYFFHLIAHAQGLPFQVQFRQSGLSASFPYMVTDVVPASDHGALVTGSYSATSTQYSSFLIRLDADGQERWVKKLILNKPAGSCDGKYVYEGVQAPDGGFLLLAKLTWSASNIGEAHIVKLDSAGNLIWKTQYQIPYKLQIEFPQAPAIRICSDGSIGIMLNTIGISHVAKLSGSGDLLWTRNISDGSTPGIQPYAMCATSDNGLLMISHGVQPTGGGSRYFMMVTKCDNAGNVVFNKYIRYDAVWEYLMPRDVVETSQGNFLITGISDGSTQGTGRPFAISTDASGSVRWIQVYNHRGESEHVAALPDGSFVLSGIYMGPMTTYNRGFLLHADSTGLPLDYYVTPDTGYIDQTDVWPDGMVGLSWHMRTRYTIAIKRNPSGFSSLCGWSSFPVSIFSTSLAVTDSAGPWTADTLHTPFSDPGAIGLLSWFTKDTCAIVSELPEHISPIWTIYPNPAQDYLEIRGSDEIHAVDIFSSSGERVRHYGNGDIEIQIDLTSLPKGLYLFRVLGKNGEISWQVVIE